MVSLDVQGVDSLDVQGVDGLDVQGERRVLLQRFYSRCRVFLLRDLLSSSSVVDVS